MKLDSRSEVILAAINNQFVMYASKGKLTAYHVASGDEMGRESFIAFCARHYGELTGVETKIVDGKQVETVVSKESGRAWWDWKSNDKRVVRHIVLEPGVTTGPDVYNRWDDLQHTMVAPNPDATIEDIQPLLEHLMFISDDDEEGVTYFMNWLATLYRYPAVKIPTCIMFYSRRTRMGKTMLYKLLSPVLGPEMVGCVAGHELHARFSDFMESRRLIVLNELARSDKQDGYEKFKNTVSEEVTMFEGKGRAAKSIRNIAHFIVTTNNVDCLPLMEKDGRFLVLRCEAERRPDSYYQKFGAWVEGPGPSLLAGVFSKWQFPDDWEPRAPVPMTKATRRTQIESRSPLHLFVDDLIQQHRPPFDKDWGRVVPLVDQLSVLYPGNMKGMKFHHVTLGKVLKDLGFESKKINIYKGNVRTSATCTVWRHEKDWTDERLKEALENE